MTPIELMTLCATAEAHSTPEGIPWPISLTFRNGTHRHSVLCLRVHVKVQEDIRLLEGYDLERDEPIQVSVDDLADARLLEGTWEYAPRQVAQQMESILVSGKWEKWLAKVTRNDIVVEQTPLGDQIPVRYLGLQAPGREFLTKGEAAQQYDVPVGSIVLAVFENDRGITKFLSLKVLKSSAQGG